MFNTEAVHRYDGNVDERRSCRRTTLQWVVLVFFGGDQWGKLIDLSERGMRFEFDHPPALRQSINFTFEAMGCMAIPTEGHEGKVFGDSIQATGRVKWTREFERTAGVEFLELSAKSRDQIRYWISSGASQEVASPSRESHPAWDKKRSKKADQKVAPFQSAALAPAPHAPAAAPSLAKASFEPREPVFEKDLENRGSDIEVVWEPERPATPATLDEPRSAHRKWPRESEREAAFTPMSLDEPAVSPTDWPGETEPQDSFSSPTTLDEPLVDRKWPLGPQPESAFDPPALDDEPAVTPRTWSREPEPERSYLPPTFDEAAAAELREKLDAFSHRKRTLEPEAEDAAAAPSLDEPVADTRNWPSEPASEPEELDPLPSDRRGFWGSKAALPSGAPSLDYDVPGMLHHDERQRLGQTLELKQRRGRFGFIAVLGVLATLGALGGIIRFTSKFNERAEATESASRPSENKGASDRAVAGASSEPGSPFLVEVLDASNRRSVLLFSPAAHSSKSGRAEDSSFLPEASAIAVQEPRDEKKTAGLKRENSRDFSLTAPHAAASGTSADAALEAPALPSQVPTSLDVSLQNLPNPAMPGALDRTPPVGGDVQPARLIHAVLPTYPQIARSSRASGDVTLDALVDAAGNVRDVKVVSGPLLLREAAQEALRQWKYEPARLDGQPTAMHLTVTVKFQSQDNH